MFDSKVSNSNYQESKFECLPTSRVYSTIVKKVAHLNKRVLDPFFHRPVPPEQVLGVDDQGGVGRVLLGVAEQLLGGVRVPVQQDVLAELQQLTGNLVVEGQITGVYDA